LRPPVPFVKSKTAGQKPTKQFEFPVNMEGEESLNYFNGWSFVKKNTDI
jgi:hypothetical protein